MKQDATTHAGRIWLTVASGGRWSADEVRAEHPHDKPKRVAEVLWTMEQRGDVVRFEDGRYGVTADCTIPPRLTVRSFLDAVGKP